MSNEAEINRYNLISNKRLRSACVNLKLVNTDSEVWQAWIKFNKKEADWEKYCRIQRYEAKHSKKNYHVDYSHLAYNGVADDF